jgi:hypothetical protein
LDDATADDYANLILRTLRDSPDERWRQLAGWLTEDIAQGRPVAIQRSKRGPSEVDLRRASEKAFAAARPLNGLERLELLLAGVRAALVDVPEMVADILGVVPAPDADAGQGPFRGSALIFEVPEEVAAEGERVGPLPGTVAQGAARVEPPHEDEMAPIRRLSRLLGELESEIETGRYGSR